MLINLGNLEMSEGRFDLAKKHLDAALQKEPDHPLAIINLASLALRQNDFATARTLAHLFRETFKTYEAGAGPEVRAAGPA